MTLTSLLTLANFLVIIGGIIGGWFVLRSSIAKAEADVQTRIRVALNDENKLLKSQIERAEKEIGHLSKIIRTIRRALKLRGLHIEIQGDFVTLIDTDGQTNSTQMPSIAKVRSIKLTPIDEDDAG